MSTINLTSVRKSFGKAEVIHGIDIDIQDGELIVFVGPSGCGKSTLLRMVAGLETVTSGDIMIDGNRVNDLEPMDRNIAMVFQNYALYPHMSVFNNMAYGLKISGTPKAEIEERVRSTAKLLQLEEYLDRKPRQLSGGQRQRVAMGRAIVRKPSVFLFDEPLSNLDAKLRVQMRIEIKRLQRELGVTSIYVTHDQTEAMTLADRLAVINNGLVEQMGSPMELYSNPQTLFVASFIGSPHINLLPARAENGHLQTGDIRLEGFGALPSDVPLMLGIRPEHLSLRDEGPFEIAVDLVEKLGADSLVYGEVQGINGGDAKEICLRSDEAAGHAPGDRVRLGFDPDRAMVFREDSGERLM